jgi:hypothetical protein
VNYALQLAHEWMRTGVRRLCRHDFIRLRAESSMNALDDIEVVEASGHILVFRIFAVKLDLQA